MKFHKDILIIDFEGFKDPVQIGAVLLDKETLEKKKEFSSYIYADLQGFVSKTTGITQEMIDDAPTQAEVMHMIIKEFGTNYFIGTWVGDLDIRNFKKLLDSAEMEWSDFDYHILDIWPIAYAHLLKQGYTGGIHSEEIFQTFGINPRGKHDALEDAQIASRILRKIMFEN